MNEARRDDIVSVCTHLTKLQVQALRKMAKVFTEIYLRPLTDRVNRQIATQTVKYHNMTTS